MSTHQCRTLGRGGALIVAVFVISACGNQVSHDSMGGMDMGGSAKAAKATLVPANAVAGAGTANLAVVNNEVHVDVRAQQLTASTKYTVHIHSGSCASIGNVIKTVGGLQTDTSGAGTVHLEYAGSDVPHPAFVDVHMPTGTEGPAVCGDLQ